MGLNSKERWLGFGVLHLYKKLIIKTMCIVYIFGIIAQLSMMNMARLVLVPYVV